MSDLYLYSFSKRHKSTKQPAQNTGTKIENVYLKDGTSITSPVFLLNIGNGALPSYNYCEWEGRYYFINDMRSNAMDLWELVCEEDYLSTGKTAIGNTTAMILYCTGGANNIVDNRIPLESDVSLNIVNDSMDGFTITSGNQGTIILSITGTGSFGNYIMQNSTQLSQLLENALLSYQSTVTNFETWGQQQLSGGSAPENLKSAIALPIISPQMTQMPLTDLWLGNYQCTDSQFNPIKGYKITDPIVEGNLIWTLPWRYSDWRRMSPYTTLYLYLPLIGTMTLPTNDLIDCEKINAHYAVNITSGDVAVEVIGIDTSAADHRIIATASGNCAMATPYGSSNISGAKVVNAAVTGAFGSAAALLVPSTAGKVIALGSSLAASAAQMIGAAHGETAGVGGLGGGATHALTPVGKLFEVTKDLTETPANMDTILGKPYMKKHQISTITTGFTGYVQTDGMQVEGNLLDSERENINSLCDGGFYYE